MLLKSQVGPVLTLTIDDPERRNPLTTRVIEELTDSVRTADSETRIIVVTGAGDKAFCAGGDLAGGFFDSPIETHRQRSGLADLFRAMRAAPQPIVARVNGHALAGGFGLMLACDLAVTTDRATFGMPEVSVGLWPMMISAVVQRALPQKVALDLMLSGRRIDAAEAFRIGAVSRVVPHDELDIVVDELVGSVVASSAAIVGFGKAAFYGAADMGFDAALDLLATGLTAVALTEDAREGTAAFIEKRSPDFSGR